MAKIQLSGVPTNVPDELIPYRPTIPEQLRSIAEDIDLTIACIGENADVIGYVVEEFGVPKMDKDAQAILSLVCRNMREMAETKNYYSRMHDIIEELIQEGV